MIDILFCLLKYETPNNDTAIEVSSKSKFNILEIKVLNFLKLAKKIEGFCLLSTDTLKL